RTCRNAGRLACALRDRRPPARARRPPSLSPLDRRRVSDPRISAMPIRVLLVDDHELVRQGVASMLAKAEDLTVVGEAKTGLEAMLSEMKPGAATPSAARSLTKREREILALVAEGLSNREIADKLVLSPETVKSHVAAILEKLNVSDRTQAAIYAVRNGLVESSTAT